MYLDQLQVVEHAAVRAPLGFTPAVADALPNGLHVRNVGLVLIEIFVARLDAGRRVKLGVYGIAGATVGDSLVGLRVGLEDDLVSALPEHLPVVLLARFLLGFRFWLRVIDRYVIEVHVFAYPFIRKPRRSGRGCDAFL
jgi:hypothetical protein